MQVKEEEAKKRKYSQFWKYLTDKKEELYNHGDQTEKKQYEDTKKALASSMKICDFNIDYFKSRIVVEPIKEKMDEIMKTIDEDDKRYKQLNKKPKH